AEIEARLDGRARASASDLTGADIAAAWEALTTDERREVISLVATIPIVVTPGRDDQQRVVPAQERLQLRPAWDPNPYVSVPMTKCDPRGMRHAERINHCTGRQSERSERGG